jgi:hypothetical protein
MMMQYLGLPEWAQYLLQGILLFVGLSSGAVVLSRAGRSPYFTFLLIVPCVQIAALWYLAFSHWPPALKKVKKREE